MRIALLWDPFNPIVPVQSIINALGKSAEIIHVTFEQIGHRTLPNEHCKVSSIVRETKADILIWIEGGPFPSDLDKCLCLKVCWIINSILEPTLYDLASHFDLCLTTYRTLAVEEKYRWLPLAASGIEYNTQPGISFLGSDPLLPAHALLLKEIDKLEKKFTSPKFPLMICPGTEDYPHPALFDSMAGEGVTIIDEQTDIRDIAHAGEHLLRFPKTQLASFIRQISEDQDLIGKVKSRGKDIVDHLHTPKLRALQLMHLIAPPIQILSGQNHQPAISVLTFCYKYLKRFRFYLESFARQNIAPGTLEIVVVDPQSPDGLKEYLIEFSQKNPHLRVIHMSLPSIYKHNRGVCINRAFNVCSGETIISTDGDILFPKHLVDYFHKLSINNPNKVFGVRRIFLNQETTNDILSGQIDPFPDFDQLSLSPGDGEPNAHEGILGYCQVVSRKGFAKARYPEEFDMINQSDIVFLERLAKYANIQPVFIGEECVLHLWHPRNWEGTEEFL